MYFVTATQVCHLPATECMVHVSAFAFGIYVTFDIHGQRCVLAKQEFPDGHKFQGYASVDLRGPSNLHSQVFR